MDPIRVVLTSDGWEPSEDPAPPGKVAWRFPRSLPLRRFAPSAQQSRLLPRPMIREGRRRHGWTR